MKFVLGNKKEILAVLSETEKKIAEIRFCLTKLPQEFEFTAVADEQSTEEPASPVLHN